MQENTENVDVYVFFSNNMWNNIKKLQLDAIIIYDELYNYHEGYEWIKDQVSKRANIPINECYPYFASLSIHENINHENTIICKVSIDKNKLVYIDDNMYVFFLNSISNNFYLFNSINENEDIEKKNASKDECFKSYERMFQLDLPRDISWVGNISLFVFLPYLTKSMLSEIKF